MTILKDQAGNSYNSTNRIYVEGQVAHDGVQAGFPFRIAGKAVNVAPAAVSATSDVHDLITTMVGALIQKPFAIPEADWQFACAAPITATTDMVAKAAGGAGIRNYVTAIQIINTSATPTEYVIKDGVTVIFRGFAPANMTAVDDTVFPTPLRGTAATAVNVAAITTAANIYVNVQGYQAP